MNIYVIIIGVLLVVLMVVFGHNPVEEARKRRAAEGSSDPVVHKIEQYQKEKHWGRPGGTFGPGATPGSGAMSGGNGVMPSERFEQRTYQVSPFPQQNSAPQNQPEPQDNGSYYPPAPPGVPASPLQQQQQQQVPPSQE